MTKLIMLIINVLALYLILIIYGSTILIKDQYKKLKTRRDAKADIAGFERYTRLRYEEQRRIDEREELENERK